MKRGTAITLVLLLTAFVFIAVLSTNRQPSYGGKSLDDWLEELDTKSARDADTPAARAIRAMEKDALPLLIARVRRGETFWHNLLESGWVPRRFHPKHNRQIQASMGLACLREKAVPELATLLNTKRAQVAAVTLGRMCPIGAPALCAGLTNANAETRGWCINVLSAVNSWATEPGYEDRLSTTARIAVPHIADALNDADPWVAFQARKTLLRFSTNSAVDAVTRDLATRRLAPNP